MICTKLSLHFLTFICFRGSGESWEIQREREHGDFQLALVRIRRNTKKQTTKRSTGEDNRLEVLWSRVSAASTTARWSSRVCSTEHPEFRSSPSDNSEGTGPLQDHYSSINQPHGHRVICQTSKYLEAHVANYPVFTPSTELERDEP